MRKKIKAQQNSRPVLKGRRRRLNQRGDRIRQQRGCWELPPRDDRKERPGDTGDTAPSPPRAPSPNSTELRGGTPAGPGIPKRKSAGLGAMPEGQCIRRRSRAEEGPGEIRCLSSQPEDKDRPLTFLTPHFLLPLPPLWSCTWSWGPGLPGSEDLLCEGI